LFGRFPVRCGFLTFLVPPPLPTLQLHCPSISLPDLPSFPLFLCWPLASPRLGPQGSIFSAFSSGTKGPWFPYAPAFIPGPVHDFSPPPCSDSFIGQTIGRFFFHRFRSPRFFFTSFPFCFLSDISRPPRSRCCPRFSTNTVFDIHSVALLPRLAS